MRGFWSNAKGNVAILFALAIIPIFGAVAAAVDYSIAASYRSDLQKSLDSAALALARMMPANQAELDAAALQYIAANMGAHSLSNLQVDVSANSGYITLTANGDYSPQMAGLLGIGTFEVGANSQAKWSVGKVEIALVLDVSLSMNSLGRIQALRQATRDLIDVLEGAEREPGDAKVAIIPFDGMVRVPFGYADAPNWIRWDWWDENYGQDVQSCQGSGKGKGKGKQSCTTTWQPEPQQNWVGCIYDRDQNHDVLDTAPNMNAAPNSNHPTWYPAAKCHNNAIQAITPLTSDWSLLRNRANSLTPTGWTNITIGMVWGWHLLSPTGPYNQGVAYDEEDVSKYLILMTDGENTKNRFLEPSSCWSCSQVDSRTSAVCTNIKNAGIKIYSVRLIEGNVNLIRSCATDPSMYYDVQNASQLAGVFTSIGSEITSLHLSK